MQPAPMETTSGIFRLYHVRGQLCLSDNQSGGFFHFPGRPIGRLSNAWYWKKSPSSSNPGYGAVILLGEIDIITVADAEKSSSVAQLALRIS